MNIKNSFMRNFQISGRSTIHSQNGMVATSHPIAVSVGLDILKKGGNAIDGHCNGFCSTHL